MEENEKVYVTYKDRLFRMLFKDKTRLLELYNAMNGTTYENPEDLEVVTLENAIYMDMKNDLAFVFYDSLTLYEHQSTKNPNIPLRDLFYVSDTYSAMVRNDNLYGSRLIRIPEPRFVVFYNGTAKVAEREQQKLSDAYVKKTEDPALELRVQVININKGYNEELMESCLTLKGYMIFVDKVRSYRTQMSLEAVVDRAITECIQEDVLADFLRKNRTEVKSVCLYEYDQERHIQMEREEAMEEGREEGHKEGREEGRKEGIEEGQKEGQCKERENGIRMLIETCEQLRTPTEQILEILQEKYSLTREQAEESWKRCGKK